MQHYSQIQELIVRVRARWRVLSALHAVVRGALIAAVVVGAFAFAARWTHGARIESRLGHRPHAGTYCDGLLDNGGRLRHLLYPLPSA